MSNDHSLIALLALAALVVGCSAAPRHPGMGTGVIVVPVRFVSASGDELAARDRPADANAQFGVIPGEIFGKIREPVQSEAIGSVPITSIDLDEFRSAFGRQAATMTAVAVASGWQIAPAETRFARVASSASYEGVQQGSARASLRDSESENTLLLVFFDRPCRLTGAVLNVTSGGTITRYSIDVNIEKAGLSWLEFSHLGDDDHHVIRNVSRTVRPLLVVEILNRYTNTKAGPSRIDSAPVKANDYVTRGNGFLDHREYARAISDFDIAIDLDPKNAMAIADRGMAYFWQGNYQLSRMDLEAAFRLNPRNPVVYRGFGMLELQAGDLVQAIAAFTASLQIEPSNEFALEMRARTYLRGAEPDKALLDYAAAIRFHPDRFNLYADRAIIFRAQGSADQSIEEAKALIAANPTNPRAYVVAGSIYAASGRDAEAMHAFDRAVEMSSDESAYMVRAGYRPITDLAVVRADVDAALKLNPQSASASIALSKLQSDAGNFAGALATLGAGIAFQPDNYQFFTERGIVYTKSGQVTLAERDFAAARSLATSATSLNSLCWAKATAGVMLDTALAECNASVAQDRRAASFDSRGFVLLRLGRFTEAVASYDAALQIGPLSQFSLYGRSLAKRRLGRFEEADADSRLALRVDARISQQFALYGLAQ